MSGYFSNIGSAVSTLWDGMRVTMRHFVHKKQLNATLQYPREHWPLPERAIGFEEARYNSIRTRLHVDIDDCIGCLQCVRACPVDCIKIDTIKAPKDMDLGTTSNGTALRLLVTRFDIDMAECCFCNLCTYPCPEDCIYMTGGPNARKQPLDYEFSVRNRDGLVFQFATATDDEVARLAETVGVPDPRAQRAARREAYYREEIVTVAVAAEEKGASSPVSKTATANEESAPAKKVDLSVLNGISDRTARGKAKAILSRTMRQGGSIKVAADEIRTTLSGLGKLNSEIEEILTNLEN